MATTQFAFGNVGRAASGGLVPVVIARSVSSEEITPSASNQTTTATATAGIGRVCRVTTDTSVYVSFGSAPDATTDTTRILVLANSSVEVAVEGGDKGACVTI